MSVPTKYAVLGLVARRPTYGYALMQQLRRWAVDPTTIRTSSIYTALTRLEREQLIEQRGSAPATASERQPRITYGVTPAGNERLDRWYASKPASYEELRIRIALARPQDIDTLIGFVHTAEQECLDLMHGLDAPALDAGTVQRQPWEALCGAILGSLDMTELAARSRWLQDARAALEAIRADTPDA